jgi:DNA-binding phage protein
MRQTAVNRFFSATVCPRLDTFLKIIHALEINLTIKDKDKNISYEELMEQVQKELNY